MKPKLTQKMKATFLSILFVCFAALPAIGQLSLTKELTTGDIKPGDTITYRLTYLNSGATYQDNVVITDVVPEYAEYVSSSPEARQVGNTLIWDKDVAGLAQFAHLSSGSGEIYVSFKVGQKLFTDALHPTRDMRHLDPKTPPAFDAITSTQTVTNTAKIMSDDVTEVSSSASQATVTQICSAEVSIAAPGSFKSNTSNSYKYIIALTNTGNVWNYYDLSTITPPPPIDTNPGDPVLVPVTQNQPLSSKIYSMDDVLLYERAYNQQTGSLYHPTPWVAPGETYMFVLELSINSGTSPSINQRSRDNVTRVVATPKACGPVATTDIRTIICTGGGCSGVETSLSTYKQSIPQVVQSGDILEYNIILYNNHVDNQGNPLSVTGVSLKEIYPSEKANVISVTPLVHLGTPQQTYTKVTANTAPGNYTESAAMDEWVLHTLYPGITQFRVKIQLKPNIKNNTTISNTLKLYYGTQHIMDFTETTLVKSAPDLYVKKTADKESVEVGDTVTYTIHYKNNGNYESPITTLNDNYDEDKMEVVVGSIGNGGFDSSPIGNITWDLGPVAIGGEGTVSYQLRVKNQNYTPGTHLIYNTADIYPKINENGTEIDLQDKNYIDNKSTASVEVSVLPDLLVTKTVDKENIYKASEGGTLTYTIKIENIGLVALETGHGGFNVNDTLPAGVIFDTSSVPLTSQSTVPATGQTSLTWHFDAIGIGEEKTITVTVKDVDNKFVGETIINTATAVIPYYSDKDESNNSDTATTLVSKNLWVGFNDTFWNDAGNWTFYVPAPGEDVEFATSDNYYTSALEDLHLDVNRNIGDLINQTVASTDPAAEPKALVVTNNNTLIIEGTAQTLVNEHIRIQSKVGEGNGALVFTQPTQNPSVKATVEYDSKSQKVTDNVFQYEWQYIGTPVQGATPNAVFGQNVSGSKYGPLGNVLIRIYSEPKNDPSDIGDKWNDADLTIPMVPFKAAYEVVQPDAQLGKIYEFKGILNVGDFSTGNLGFTSGAYFRGNYILANSYAAPIRIDKLSADDFDNLEQTIYLFNTGSREQWIEESGWSTENGLSTLKGTYYAIPRLISDVLNVYQIPSLNGFLVRRLKNDAGYVSDSDIQFDFRYASLVKDLDNLNNTTTKPMYVQGVSKAPAKVAGESSGKYPLLKIDLVNGSKVDRVMLVTAPNTTKKFDNGWDGYKLLASGETQIYTFPEGTDRFQVNTDSDLDGTILGVYNGSNGTEFKLDFHMQDMQGVYHTLNIEDLQTGTIKDITDGGSYTFTVNASSPEARFRINGIPVMGVPTSLDSPIEVIYHKNKDVIVINGSDEEGMLRIYDIAGKQVQQLPITTGQTSEKLKLRKGIYVFDVRTTSYRSTHKIIVQ